MGQKRNTIIAIVAILIVVIIGGAAGGYWYYKRTPTYSLKLIGRAIQEHDWYTFDAQVDVDQVAEDFVAGLLVMGMSDNYTSIKQSDKDEIFDNEEFDILVDNVSAEIENILRNKKAPTSYGDDVTE